MLPVTSSGYPDRSAGAYPSPSAPDSSEFAKGLFENFKHQLNFLPPGVCSEYIRNILTHVSTEFPDDMSEFQKALNERTVTLAENSSETRAVSINPMRKLLDKYECFELPDNLSSLVKSFNSELTCIINLEGNTEIPPLRKEYDMEKFSKSMANFGRFIFKRLSPLCDKNNRGFSTDSQCRAAALQTQNALESWHYSIRILCEGVIDPLLAKLGSLNNDASEKKKSIELLNEMQGLIQTHEKKDYFKIDKLLKFLGQGLYGDKARSHLIGLILEDFIGCGNPIVFQETLQMLFKYYQFTPEPTFIKISTQLNDTIKSYSENPSRN